MSHDLALGLDRHYRSLSCQCKVFYGGQHLTLANRGTSDLSDMTGGGGGGVTLDLRQRVTLYLKVYQPVPVT